MLYNIFLGILLSKVHNFSILRTKSGVSKGFEKMFRNFFYLHMSKKNTNFAPQIDKS